MSVFKPKYMIKLLCGSLNLIKDTIGIKYLQNILLTIFGFTAALDCSDDSSGMQ